MGARGGLSSDFSPEINRRFVRPAFQIGSLRVEGIHRVVRWLMQPMQDANRTSRLDGRRHNGVGEQRVVHGLAAMENVKRRLPAFMPSMAQVDSFVALNSGMSC